MKKFKGICITICIIILAILGIELQINKYKQPNTQYNEKWKYIEELPFSPISLNISNWIIIHPLRYNDANFEWCSIHYINNKSWTKWYVYQGLIVDYNKKEIWFTLWTNNFVPSLCNKYYNDFLLEYWYDYNNIFPKLNILDKNLAIYYPSYKRLNYEIDTCNYIYYIPIIEADFNSFVLRTWWMYASDKNNIYIFWRHDIPYYMWIMPNFNLLKNEKWVVYYPYYKIATQEDIHEIKINQNNINNKDCNETLPKGKQINKIIRL
jgi:hypothetical protein